MFKFSRDKISILLLNFTIFILLSCASSQQTGEQSDEYYNSENSEQLNSENIAQSNQQQDQYSSGNENYDEDGYAEDGGPDNYDNVAAANESAEINSATSNYPEYSESNTGGNYAEKNPFGNQQNYNTINNYAEKVQNQTATTNENIPANGFGTGNNGNAPMDLKSNLVEQKSQNNSLTVVNNNSRNSSGSPKIIRPSENELRYYVPSYDLMPTRSLLWWVGYNLPKGSRKVQVEMVTRGAPRFDLFMEKNKADQPEIVVRFYDASMRKKMKRDIDATEFKSPIAYIRARERLEEEAVDVVLTLRESVKPRLFARNGNILLTFDLDAKYLTEEEKIVVPESKGVLLAAVDYAPIIIPGSDLPKSYAPAPYIPDQTEGAFSNKSDSYDGELVELKPQELPGQNVYIQDNPIYLETSPVSTNGAMNYNNMNLPKKLNAQPINNTVPQRKAAQMVPAPMPQLIQPQVAPMMNPKGDGFPKQPIQQQPVNGYQNNGNNIFGPDEFEEEEMDDFEDTDSDDADKFEVHQYFEVEKYYLKHVAQYDGEEDFENGFEETPNNNPGDGNIGNVQDASLNANPLNNNLQAEPNEGIAGLDDGNYNNLGLNNPAPGNAPMQVAQVQPVANINNDQYGNPYANPVAQNGNPMLANDGYVDQPNSDLYGQDYAAPQVADGAFPPVRLVFTDVPLKDVIKVLGTENNVNFLFPSDIGEAKISLSLKGVSWDNALRAVLETNNLGMVQLQGGIYRIEKLAILAEEKDRLLEIQEKSDLLSPTKIVVFRLSYTQAKDIKVIAETLLASRKEYDKRVKVDIDNRTNSLIVESTQEDIEKIAALIQRVDMQTPQVQISSRIVEVLEDSRNEFGIDWSGPFNFNQGRGLGFGNLVFPNNVISSYAIDTGAKTIDGSGINAHLGSINNSFELDLQLRAQERMGKTKIIQNPSVTVQDNETASFEVGRQDFVKVTNRDGESNLVPIDYTLKFDITPQISIDGAVKMNVSIQNDSPLEGVQDAKSRRVLKTSLLVENGETRAIGGLFSTQESQGVSGVPFLSKIPIIGALFRTSKVQKDRRELITLITPNIVNGAKSTNRNSIATTTAGSNSNYSDVTTNVAGANYQDNYSNQESNQQSNQANYSQQQNQQEQQNNNQYGGEYEETAADDQGY